MSENQKQKYQLQLATTGRAHFSTNCTYLRIGKHGEVLTNLHCIERMLLAQLDTTPIYFKVVGGTKNEFLPVNPRNPKKFRDDVKGGGKVSEFFNVVNIPKEQLPIAIGTNIVKDGELIFVPKFKLLWVSGPGWIESRHLMRSFYDLNPERYFHVADKGYNNWGDLAVVQILDEQNTEKTCFPLQPTPVFTSAEVFTISYPCFRETLCSSHECSGGRYTEGFATSQMDQVPVFRDLMGQENLLRWISPPKTFRADLDSGRCASGSPVFLKDSGNLVGVVYTIYREHSYDGKYVPWSTQVIDLSHHIEEIQQAVPSHRQCLFNN